MMLAATRPSRLILAVCSAAALALCLFVPAGASLNTTGKWTSKYDNSARWSHIAVHLALTRGTAYHSQILWYNSHPEGSPIDDLLGGVWGWNPAIGTHEANCDSYPANSFTALTHGEPGHNVFCSGMTVLSNGHVLIAGGSENGGEVGVTSTLTFDPSTRNFTVQDTMAQRRWYPTCTALPDGRALITSGSTFIHEWCFGGRPSPTSTSVVANDSLQMYGEVHNGLWDTPVKDVSSGSTTWPVSREGLTATFNAGNSEVTLFGGINGSGSTPYNETWFIYRLPDTDSGPHYKASQQAGGSAPSGRYRHSAVVPGDSTMIVFGGRGLFSANHDVYELYQLSGVWTWQLKTVAGTPPSSRQGHTALWDSENECMLVFGGTDVNGAVDRAPQDSVLHVLTRGSTWNWSTAAVDPDTDGTYPCPRYGHAMVMDALERYTTTTGLDSQHERRALMFGGCRSSAAGVKPDSLLNDLWVLWIPEAGSGAHYVWRRVPPPDTLQPAPRMRFAMFDDAVNDRLIISGGTTDSSAATATEYYIPLVHITGSNDLPWVQLPDYRLGAVTGHVVADGQLNWSFGQEIFDPSYGTWTAQGSKKRQDWYPFGFVAPQTDSIRVFYAGPDTQSYYYNLSGSTPYWRPYPAATPGFRSGSAVMYLPGKVMVTLTPKLLQSEMPVSAG